MFFNGSVYIPVSIDLFCQYASLIDNRDKKKTICRTALWYLIGVQSLQDKRQLSFYGCILVYDEFSWIFHEMVDFVVEMSQSLKSPIRLIGCRS